MSDLMFKKAVRYSKKARIALLGPTGSGKSLTALRLAFALAPTGKVAAIDTEHGSLSLYSGDKWDGKTFNFDTVNLVSFSPDNYIESIKLAEKAGYEVLIIDSLSHAWAGKDGTLEYVDNVAERSKSGSSFMAWRQGTKLQNELVETMLAANLHLIVTMRTKTEYVQEKDKDGRTTIRKVGLQPIQREGIEYEFDLVCDMTMENELVVSKTRCSALSGKSYHKPGAELGEALLKWLNTGEEAPAEQPRVAKVFPDKTSTASDDKWKWVLDGKRVEGFFKTANDKFSLSDDEALEALGVSGLVEYRGAPADAMAALSKYVNEHAREPIMPETANE